MAEKLITLAKRGDLHARRQAAAYIQSKDVVAKLFDAIRTQYAERPGGYTTIIQTGTRLGDAAPMAVIELVERNLSQDVRMNRDQTICRVHDIPVPPTLPSPAS